MDSKKSELRLLNDDDEVLCSIDVVMYYDEENEYDEGEIFFLHVLTGSQCETIEQVFQGWSEQNKEAQEQWEKLENFIEDDRDLAQKICDLDEVDYYI
ncbi:hypothetical protein [uncultured Clostridium sp.]|jgi:hypothetical protein|uniref:hypothetical protein n=1 Tax=uncultured Clostridium sp. TaxID=59620 RepID=UPI00261FB93B|nr:hypothetical protein [uncultured Clostridium sp.]